MNDLILAARLAWAAYTARRWAVVADIITAAIIAAVVAAIA